MIDGLLSFKFIGMKKHQQDEKNVIDTVRHLFSGPPVGEGVS